MCLVQTSPLLCTVWSSMGYNMQVSADVVWLPLCSKLALDVLTRQYSSTRGFFRQTMLFCCLVF